jgi:hypothetical protein
MDGAGDGQDDEQFLLDAINHDSTAAMNNMVKKRSGC